MFLKSDKERLENIRGYILENLDADINIKLLGATFGISVPTLRRQFHLHFRMPVYKYISKQRMEYAKELILGERHTIGEISELVGYSDQSNFSHAFTNYFGIAPSRLAAKNEG